MIPRSALNVARGLRSRVESRRAARHVPLLFAGMVFLGLFLGFLNLGCQTIPFSSRRQLVIIPEQQEIQMGEESYRQILSEEKLSENQQAAEAVRRVGQRIAAVSGRDDFDWEFQLIASDKMNAFALPGGKVAVYEGILEVCENEAGLAVVMSHEIAHALARHGGERMSHQAIVNAGSGVLQRVMRNKDEQKRARLMHAYGLGTKYGVVLPYSREHEMEADSIGLSLMAKAGYDPREAPRFWKRFSEISGHKPPEFLSTHPSDLSRANNLTGLLPQAMALYEAAEQQYGQGISLLDGMPVKPTETGEDLSRLKMVAYEDSEPTGQKAEPSSDAAPLAFPSEAPKGSLIEQASYEIASEETFLPPLQRAPVKGGSAVPDNPSESGSGEPRPFPGANVKPIESPDESTSSADWLPTQK